MVLSRRFLFKCHDRRSPVCFVLHRMLLDARDRLYLTIMASSLPSTVARDVPVFLLHSEQYSHGVSPVRFMTATLDNDLQLFAICGALPSLSDLVKVMHDDIPPSNAHRGKPTISLSGRLWFRLCACLGMHREYETLARWQHWSLCSTNQRSI